MKIISRAEAKQLNLKRYFTGKHCKHGHIGERYVNNGGCCECVSTRKKLITSNKILDKNNNISREEAFSKGFKYYFTGKPCKHGHVAERYASNALCKECCRINSANRRKSHPEYMVEYNRNYKERRNSRPKSDPDYKCMLRMRCMLRRILKSTNTNKNNRTVALVGYTPNELRCHIESLFTDGMSWENHGEWHIDHIIPVSVLIKYGFTDPAFINGLENLQPLWEGDNLSKSDKIL